METELKRKLAAILVADVVGYSRLIADDEEATLRRLEVFRTLWQDCVARTGGRIFNTAGDAILAEFPSAVEAVRCALDFQHQAAVHNDGLVPKRQMHFRVGITIGDVVLRGGDLLGDGVNVAARLQTLAGPGGICVSSWVREAVANKLGVRFADLGDQSVKNIPDPIRAYLVGGVDGAPLLPDRPAREPDWLGRAVSSWRGMAAVLGVAAAGVVGAMLLVSQFRGSAPVPVVQPKTSPIVVAPPGKGPDAPAGPKVATIDPKPATGPVTPPKAPRTDPPPAKADPAVRLGRLTEAVERELKMSDRFKECETCPEMVVVPRGEFVMGSVPGQPGHEADEAPAHKVAINVRIAVARYAVTVADFETFVAVTGYRPGAGCRVFEGGRWTDRPELSFRNPGFPQVPDHPVVCVNWNDAKAFTDWMTARMSGEYRLPTEAEREYATRAGSTTPFWWGNEIAPSRASYDWTHVFGTGPRGEARRGTHPVGAFGPSPWGLFQMHGNVSEWVEDCWNDTYRGAPVDGSAWQSGDCRRRVLRGGSWGYAPKDLRASYREGATLTYRNFNFGFRVVRVLRGGR